MKKFLKMMLALSVLALAVSGCNIFGNDDDEKAPETTPSAYTLPKSIDVLSATGSEVQSSLHSISYSVSNDKIEIDCPVADKGYYAEVKTCIYHHNEVLLTFDIMNFLLGALDDGNYASHINDGTIAKGSSYFRGSPLEAKFKVSKESSSDVMTVKMSFTEEDGAGIIKRFVLMKVTKSVSDELPYGEFETFVSCDANNDWHCGMKVSDGLILFEQNNGECPNKMRMELSSATTGKAYYWQDERGLQEGDRKEKVSYFFFDNSEFFEYRIRTLSDDSKTYSYKSQDRTKEEYIGSDYQIFTSEGALCAYEISDFNFPYENTTYNVGYQQSDGKYYLYNRNETGKMRSRFPIKNGFELVDPKDNKKYYLKTARFTVDFPKSDKSYTDAEIKAKVDETMTYDSDFGFESFDVSDWGL